MYYITNIFEFFLVLLPVYYSMFYLVIQHKNVSASNKGQPCSSIILTCN